MTIVVSTSPSSPEIRRDRANTAATGLKAFWGRFVALAFDPYRPERHYMRGPGPAWRARHGEQAAFRIKSGDL